MLDRAFKREIDELPIICTHRQGFNCEWKGVLKNYQVSSCIMKLYLFILKII